MIDMNEKLFTSDKSEAATRGILYEKVVLEISQNSQENTCARASFTVFKKINNKSLCP